MTTVAPMTCHQTEMLLMTPRIDVRNRLSTVTGPSAR